jgi:transcriptional regulator with XRE-family HTH domain
MTERPDVPLEAVLLKTALTASPLSQRAAAERAGISESRWRQLVSGYQVVSGTKAPTRSPDDTLARMARAVDVTPEQLAAAGREGAAEVLREILSGRRDGGAGPADARNRVDERWHMLAAVLRQAGVGLTPAEYETLRGRIGVFLSQGPDGWPQDEVPPEVPDEASADAAGSTPPAKAPGAKRSRAKRKS